MRLAKMKSHATGESCIACFDVYCIPLYETTRQTDRHTWYPQENYTMRYSRSRILHRGRDHLETDCEMKRVLCAFAVLRPDPFLPARFQAPIHDTRNTMKNTLHSSLDGHYKRLYYSFHLLRSSCAGLGL
jgi:hypothetical protein